MRIRPYAYAAMVASVLGGAVGAAFARPAVVPTEGSIGTQLDIEGSGFGEKPPLVYMVASASKGPKRYVLAVVKDLSNDTHVEAVVRKAVAGVFDVYVQPAGKGVEAQVFASAFTVAPPVVDSLDKVSGSPLSEVTLTGRLFGTRKGKVRVGGKKAKVVAWTEGSVTFRIPKKLANGTYDVVVSNKIGEATQAAAFEVTGSSVGQPRISGPDRIELRVGPVTLAAKGVKAVATFNDLDDGLVLSGTQLVVKGFDTTTTTATVALTADLDQVPHDFPVIGAGFLVTRASLAGTTSYQASGPSVTVTVAQYNGSRIAGRVSGTAVPVGGGASVAVSGDFVLTVVQAAKR